MERGVYFCNDGTIAIGGEAAEWWRGKDPMSRRRLPARVVMGGKDRERLWLKMQLTRNYEQRLRGSREKVAPCVSVLEQDIRRS